MEVTQANKKFKSVSKQNIFVFFVAIAICGFEKWTNKQTETVQSFLVKKFYVETHVYVF